MRIGGDDGHAVRGRDEEAAAEDHVAVGVAVLRGAKVGHGRRAGGGGRGRAIRPQAHELDEVGGVGEVGVGVVAAKVGQRLAVAQRRLGDAQPLDEDAAAVGAGHARQPVIGHGEIRPRDKGAQRGKVKHALEQRLVHGHRVDNLHRKRLGHVRVERVGLGLRRVV